MSHRPVKGLFRIRCYSVGIFIRILHTAQALYRNYYDLAYYQLLRYGKRCYTEGRRLSIKW